MGAIIAKLWRRKKSTRELLLKIRNDLHDIEEFKQSTQAWHRKLIGYLLAYFSVLYLIAALVAYFKYYTNPAWSDFTSQFRLLAPFILAPFIFILLKRLLTWWNLSKLRRNDLAMEKLKKQKAKILDEVMDRETYKTAKELLDEFATDTEKRQLNLIKSHILNLSTRNKSMLDKRPAPNLNTSINLKTNHKHMILRQRQILSEISAIRSSPSRSQSVQSSMKNSHKNPYNSTPERSVPPPAMPISRTPIMNQPPPGPPLPRPVLPRGRSYMDRVVEYLVGDGSYNQYALICKQCQSHNGMALREEFDFLSYRCCYCHYWNPAKKQKPTAPRLLSSAIKSQILTESSSDEEESESNRIESTSEDKTEQTKEKTLEN